MPSAVNTDFDPFPIPGRQELVNCCENSTELSPHAESSQKPAKYKQESVSFNAW